MDGGHGTKLEIGRFGSTGSEGETSGFGEACDAGEKGDGINDIEERVLRKVMLQGTVYGDVFRGSG